MIITKQKSEKQITCKQFSSGIIQSGEKKATFKTENDVVKRWLLANLQREISKPSTIIKKKNIGKIPMMELVTVSRIYTDQIEM